jgi:hypothetical protein
MSRRQIERCGAIVALAPSLAAASLSFAGSAVRRYSYTAVHAPANAMDAAHAMRELSLKRMATTHLSITSDVSNTVAVRENSSPAQDRIAKSKCCCHGEG